MRVTCLVKRWNHHTPSGGYDQLARALGATIIERQRISSPISRMGRMLWQRTSTADQYLLDYQFGDFLAEYKLVGSSLLTPPDVVHVLYGDEQLNVLLRLRRYVRSPLIVSFHLPAERPIVLDRFERIQLNAPKLIDGAIVVSKSQLTRFEHWFGPEKVDYVPHGIDTDFFSPSGSRPEDPWLRILMVGHHMRDWKLAHVVIDTIAQSNLRVRFDIVTRKECFSYLTGCANTVLQHSIEEGELLAMYRTADTVLLPVTDATASNTILESLACGTPVISTTIGGIPDYVDETCGWLFPKGEAAPIVALITAMCNNREIAKSKREAARKQALNFSWPVVAKQVRAVYSKVISQVERDTLNQGDSTSSSRN